MPPPPNTPKRVILNVGRQASDAPPTGWTSVTASDGTRYCYQYSGGDEAQSQGKATFTVNLGEGDIDLQLSSLPQFQIDGVNFSNDPGNNLTWQPSSSRAGRIIDSAITVETPGYCVQIKDTGNGGITFPCDPQITNKSE